MAGLLFNPSASILLTSCVTPLKKTAAPSFIPPPVTARSQGYQWPPPFLFHGVPLYPFLFLPSSLKGRLSPEQALLQLHFLAAPLRLAWASAAASNTTNARAEVEPPVIAGLAAESSPRVIAAARQGHRDLKHVKPQFRHHLLSSVLFSGHLS
jgi:hypothetical protein